VSEGQSSDFLGNFFQSANFWRILYQNKAKISNLTSILKNDRIEKEGGENFNELF